MNSHSRIGTLTNTYTYRTAHGLYLFDKLRFEVIARKTGERNKTFRYHHRTTNSYRKPSGADDYIYRLQDTLAGIAAGRVVHWAEGEKDADALVAAGEIATSVHQGAGHVTVEQAAWLRAAREIVLWVDKDRARWEVGAYDAALRHNRLVEAGVDADRIRFVRAAGSIYLKDAYDHLKQFPLNRAVPVDKQRLALVAQRFAPASARSIGYRNA